MILLFSNTHAVVEATTLVVAGRFLLILVAARLLGELMVRLQLPTILGELLAGVLIGVSGLHLVVPPESGISTAPWLLNLTGQLGEVSAAQIDQISNSTYPFLQAVASIGLYSLLFLTGLESELDELIAVGIQASSVAFAGVILPFALGTAGLMALFHVDLVP